MSILIRAALAVCLGTLTVQDAAAVNLSYEGNWNVALLRTGGICGMDGFDYSVSIRNGSMRYLPKPSETPPPFRGTVSPNGAVAVHSVFNGADVEAIGALRASRGSGTWQASLFGCSGTWTARRTS